MAWLFWPLFTAFLAVGQGLLLPTLRSVAAGSPEATRNNFALHGLLLAAWAWPLWLLPGSWPVALACRALLFDPLINIASGKPAFYVGKTAVSDKALQAVATKTGLGADRLRAVLLLVAAGGAVAYFVLAR